MEFITLKDAMLLTGHKTHGAFDQWCRRHNAKHPESPVRRRPGYVEKGALEKALNAATNP